ncbi:unnamed protein product [Urochloa decumbens]|uniref:Rx N-terminal domain-containing protein n=1 Tax=Urochloa decumbens TaxID=240449 RepID=A0ABC9GE30_9POAL
MADMLGSAVLEETVRQILSNMEDNYKGESDTKEHMERLEMAHIRLEAALGMSEGWNITSAPLLRWRSKLKRAVQECDETLHRCKQHVREEEEEIQEGVRKSSFPSRIAHHVKSFISSIFNTNSGSTSSSDDELSISSAVRRFECFADGASEFLSQCHLLILQPISTPQGMEGRLLYVHMDGDAPENSFFFTIFLRLSESTNIVGVAVRCLQLFTPHFKSTTETVKTKLTQLPMQDFCWVPYVDSSRKQRHWENFYSIFSKWFRPNTNCCRQQQHDHDQYMQPYASSSGSNRNTTNSSSSSLLPHDVYLEPVIKVYLQGHVPVPAGHNRNKSFPYVKLRLLLSPHASSEGVLPSVGGSATEIVHGQEEQQRDGLYANISFEELDEILLPKAIDCLGKEAGAKAVYQMVWRSAHGGAYIQAEKFTPRRVLQKGRRRGHRPQGQDEKVETWSHVVTDFLGTWAPHAPQRLQGAIANWIRKEKEMQLAVAPTRTSCFTRNTKPYGLIHSIIPKQILFFVNEDPKAYIKLLKA